MGAFQDLKYKFNALDSFGKLIAINVLVFVLSTLIRILFRSSRVLSYFELPSDAMDFIIQPWSLVTYGFLHSGFFHLAFNMLLLFYLSQVAANIFRPKMVLNVYFLGIISGGLAYLAIANLWPNDFFGARGVLIGASAGVCALLAFVATYMPNTEIRLFNMFNVKWKYIALTFICLDLFRMLSGLNQGGYIAHFGGYGLGYFYAFQLKTHGKDIGAGFERIMYYIVALFQPKSKIKTVYRNKEKRGYKDQSKSGSNALDKQNKIDVILDKISKSGYESLSAEEKKFLFEAGKD